MKMNPSIKRKIANYYFQDSYQLVYATALGNFLLVLAYLMSDITNLINNSNALISLLSGLVFLIIPLLYGWKTHSINILIVFVYFCIFLLEFFTFGIPNAAINTSRFVSKGIILEFFAGLMPYIYLGFRLILIFPLARMTYANYKLNQI